MGRATKGECMPWKLGALGRCSHLLGQEVADAHHQRPFDLPEVGQRVEWAALVHGDVDAPEAALPSEGVDLGLGAAHALRRIGERR